tara:strand:+ start:8972 stop:9457 length:486 start_codon:yes stop_codon:yes gene_type:complete
MPDKHVATVTVKLYGIYGNPEVEIEGDVQDSHIRVLLPAIRQHYMTVYLPKKTKEAMAKKKASWAKTEDKSNAALAKAEAAFEALDQNFSDRDRLLEIVGFYNDLLELRPTNQIAKMRIKVLEDQVRYLNAEKAANDAAETEKIEEADASSPDAETETVGV